MNCWCKEAEGYECWQCRDERLEREYIESGDFRQLALHRGIDDFEDYKKIMCEVHEMSISDDQK